MRSTRARSRLLDDLETLQGGGWVSASQTIAVPNESQARIRNELFGHLQTLGLAFYDGNPAGRLVTRVTNDVEALNEMYTSVLVNLFKDCFMILGAAAVMLRMDWRLALVSFAVVPFVMAAAALFQKLARKGWREVRVRIAAINARISEDLSGVRLIQLFARERLQIQEFQAVNQAALALRHEQRRFAVVVRQRDFMNRDVGCRGLPQQRRHVG